MSNDQAPTDGTRLDDTSRFFKAGRRRPRFRPVEGQRGETQTGRQSRAGAFKLTERDVKIIEAVARHRFLDSTQLSRLFGSGTHNRVRERLTELFHKQFLQRPIRQRDLKIRNGAIESGSRPMVYGLGKEGDRLLAEEHRMPAGRRNWARDNSDASRIYIAHTLALADLRIGLDEAATSSGVTLRHDRELASELPRKNTDKQPGRAFAMTVTVDEFGKATTKPGMALTVDCDAAFTITTGDRTKPLGFLVEIDQGTMPVERHRFVDTAGAHGERSKVTSLKGTSLMKKIIAYDIAYDQRLDEALFGWEGFRVIILTTTEARVQSVVAAIKARKLMHPDLFRVGTTDGARATDILRYPFKNYKNESAPLLA